MSTEKLTARLPFATLAAVDAIAAREGLTRTDAINRLLIAGLDAMAQAGAMPTPAQQVGDIQVEAVFPPKLSLLLVEIAARVTLIGKQQNVDMSKAEAVRAAYRKEFL